MALKIMTLNINGLNCKIKQKHLFDFIKDNHINLISLQEHNLKNSSDLLDIFYEQFHVIINESINLKGGTAILIDKNNMCSSIHKIEKSSDSRITSVKFRIDNKYLHMLNVYAPSGSKFHQEREDLFKNQILYYLRNNLSNTILCGDFNCITSVKDKTKNGHCPVSKALQLTLNNLRLKDIWCMHHSQVEYTYYRENYGSRIDRIYAADLKENLKNILVKPISFSDHNSVIAEVDVKCNIGMGKYYWKLNTRLLEIDEIEK